MPIQHAATQTDGRSMPIQHAATQTDGRSMPVQHAAMQTDGPSCCAAMRCQLEAVQRQLAAALAQLQEAGAGRAGAGAGARQPGGPWGATEVQPLAGNVDSDASAGPEHLTQNGAICHNIAEVPGHPECDGGPSHLEQQHPNALSPAEPKGPAPSRWLVGVRISLADREAAEAQEEPAAEGHASSSYFAAGMEPEFEAGTGRGLGAQHTDQQRSSGGSTKPAQPHTCQVCGRVFRQLATLRQHTAAEHAASCGWPQCRRLQCGDCGRGLPQHRPPPTANRKHMCRVCGRRFMRPFHLREHTRIHTGEKPYVCRVCGKTFRHSGGLSNHKRECKRELFKCPVCGKVFANRESLQRHSATHMAHRLQTQPPARARDPPSGWQAGSKAPGAAEQPQTAVRPSCNTPVMFCV